MKFLVDTSPAKLAEIKSPLVGGQLLTPLTRYRNAGGVFAIDNGAFSGFRDKDFAALLEREERNKDRCLFVTVPDIVGSASRTSDLWRFRSRWCAGWPLAYVAQDGSETRDIPWEEMAAVFIGGMDPWKDGRAAADIVTTAKILGVHVHVGRVNTARRYKHFAELGADTCDGSGIARFDHMLPAIEADLRQTERQTNLFSQEVGANK